MRYLRIVILLVLGLMLPTCAARLPLNLVGRVDASPGWSEWCAAQGGMMDEPALCGRASRAVARLTEPSQPIHIHVLDNTMVTAYSYADGHIFVTRGLVEAATDDELSAAVAHELGHLYSDGHLARGTYAAFVGRTDASDKEMQADAVGVEVLRTHHISPRNLICMLQKVAAASHSSATNKALAERITALRKRLAD